MEILANTLIPFTFSFKKVSSPPYCCAALLESCLIVGVNLYQIILRLWTNQILTNRRKLFSPALGTWHTEKIAQRTPLIWRIHWRHWLMTTCSTGKSPKKNGKSPKIMHDKKNWLWTTNLLWHLYQWYINLPSFCFCS